MATWLWVKPVCAQIKIAKPPNNLSVERGYIYLQMVANKRRNHSSLKNIEKLFLLANLKMPPK